jgi:hypothetical protein
MSSVAVTAITLLIVALVFGGAAFLGIELSSAVGGRLYAEREAAPFPARMRFALIGAAALLGLLAAAGKAEWQALTLAAIVCVSLAASWHSSTVYQKVPDYFTLVPLGSVVIAAAIQSEWFLILGAVVPFVPFAAMARFGKGRGFDWDDAKIAALGGALLGVETSIFALATACIVAVAVAFGRKRMREPIVIAPYMLGAIGAAMAVRLMP